LIRLLGCWRSSVEQPAEPITVSTCGSSRAAVSG
jgi:hypothetical protein